MGGNNPQDSQATCRYHFFVAVPVSAGKWNVCERVVKMLLTCFGGFERKQANLLVLFLYGGEPLDHLKDSPKTTWGSPVRG